jgi:hypothetical protein
MAGAISWASVVDNAAICPDEVEHGAGGGPHSTPPTSHCCLTAPCHTPTVAPPTGALAPPPAVVPGRISIVFLRPADADSPAPPTPPPTSLDQAV